MRHLLSRLMSVLKAESAGATAARSVVVREVTAHRASEARAVVIGPRVSAVREVTARRASADPVVATARKVNAARAATDRKVIGHRASEQRVRRVIGHPVQWVIDL